MAQGGDVTVLLRQWSAGEDGALDPLFQLIYPQLRSIAAALMRRERPGQELQPTGVVNEFYLKLVEQQRLQFEDRAHFFSLAARFMRRILVDQARERRSLKRDGGRPVALSDDLNWVAAAGPEILDVDRQLTELQQIDDRKCRMIELRYFLGFTVPEIAELLSLSKATVDRDLKFARAWVRDRLTKL